MDRVAVVVLQVVATLAVGGFFLTHLWIHVENVSQGFDSTVQSLIGGALDELDVLMLPLVYVAAISVVKFALDFATSVGAGSDELDGGWLRAGLVGLLLVKLWFLLFSQWSDWGVYFQDRWPTVVRTVVSLALLALLVSLVTRFRPTPRLPDARERLILGSSVALGLGSLASILVVCAGIVALTVFQVDDVPVFVDAFPASAVGDWAPVSLALLALVGGPLAAARRRPTDAAPTPLSSARAWSSWADGPCRRSWSRTSRCPSASTTSSSTWP